jgi:hypothetical protein
LERFVIEAYDFWYSLTDADIAAINAKPDHTAKAVVVAGIISRPAAPVVPIVFVTRPPAPLESTTAMTFGDKSHDRTVCMHMVNIAQYAAPQTTLQDMFQRLCWSPHRDTTMKYKEYCAYRDAVKHAMIYYTFPVLDVWKVPGSAVRTLGNFDRHNLYELQCNAVQSAGKFRPAPGNVPYIDRVATICAIRDFLDECGFAQMEFEVYFYTDNDVQDKYTLHIYSNYMLATWLEQLQPTIAAMLPTASRTAFENLWKSGSINHSAWELFDGSIDRFRTTLTDELIEKLNAAGVTKDGRNALINTHASAGPTPP